MPATAWLRRRAVELGWFAFALANLLAMVRWERWETVPFHFIWVSLTLVYGFRVWRSAATALTLGFVIVSTGVLILIDISRGTQEWGELTEVPLMSAMFMAMVWHARRRQDALGIAEKHADQLESTLEREEQFLHDASHELRTPVTIARGHLEVLERSNGRDFQEIDVALDELSRMERILDRLLLLARADQADFLELEQVELDHFLEDVFMRWSEIAPRSWRLGALAHGTLRADPEQLRIALDALLENAVKYSEPERRHRRTGRGIDADLRAVRSLRSGPHTHGRRRRARARDRRHDRQGPRRTTLRQPQNTGLGVRHSTAGLHACLAVRSVRSRTNYGSSS